MYLDKNINVRLKTGMVLILLCGFALSGCSVFGGSGVIDAGTSCIGDSSGCISKREAALNAIMADSSKAWVYDVPDGAAYLTGVRAFAYRKLLPSLTCKELQHGMMEMAAAPSVLGNDDPSGGDPAQLSRAKILSSSVQRDLSKRYLGNCKRKRKKKRKA